MHKLNPNFILHHPLKLLFSSLKFIRNYRFLQFRVRAFGRNWGGVWGFEQVLFIELRPEFDAEEGGCVVKVNGFQVDGDPDQVEGL